MASPVNEDQDQRNNAGLEDLTTMTIESLRARLLSERAISKSSRQRADELAKRVLELEEQLKMVSIQRRKAEKATADVLAILESNGISDVSDAYDSNSDQETTIYDSKVSSDTMKRMETSINFKGRRSDMEAYYSSEIDSSPSTGRSLSWKSSKDSLYPLQRKKYTETVRRRCSTFTSNVSLPKRAGKSCRRISRRETRSVPEQLQNDADMHDLQGNTVDEFSKDSPNSADIKHPANHGVGNAYYSNGNGNIEDMEGGLEHEAEGKPQREWEEKVGENSRTVLDSYDPGNRSDTTEDREEMKAPGQLNPDAAIDAQHRETNLEIVKTNFTEAPELKVSQSPPQFENACLQDQKASKTVDPGSTSLEFSFSTSKRDWGQLVSENLDKTPLQGSHTSLDPNGSYFAPSMHGHKLATKEGESSGSRKELALIPQKSSNNLESVLVALQQARLLLNQKLCSTTLSEIGSSVNGIELSVPGIRTAERMKAPFGCPGLFRLPTDFQLEATATVNHLGSNSGLVGCYPEPASERFLGSPYLEPRSSALFGNQFYTSSGVEIGSAVPRPAQTPPFPHGVSAVHSSAMPYMEIQRSRTPLSRLACENAFATGQSSYGRSAYLNAEIKSGLLPGLHASSTPFSEIRPTLSASRPGFDDAFDAVPSSFARSSYLDSQMDPGLVLPSSSRYTYPTYPFYPEVPLQAPSTNERLSRNLASMEYGMPSAAASGFPLHDDHIRQNMYK